MKRNLLTELQMDIAKKGKSVMNVCSDNYVTQNLLSLLVKARVMQ